MRLTKAANGKGSVAGELPTEIESSYVQKIRQILNHEISYTQLTLIYFLAYGTKSKDRSYSLPLSLSLSIYLSISLSLPQGKAIYASETDWLMSLSNLLTIYKQYPIHFFYVHDIVIYLMDSVMELLVRRCSILMQKRPFMTFFHSTRHE